MTRHPHRRAGRCRLGRGPRAAAIGTVLLLLAAACGTSGGATAATAPNPGDWASVLAAAKGQTVNWYMYGGDDILNTFVAGYLTDALKKDGIGLRQVRIADTADAVNAVLGQKQAGKTRGGSVDAIWINGENFATGVQAHLWSCGWPRDLPNSRYIDFTDPAVTTDFGVPVDDCEAVWQRADSALVYDSGKLSPADVASVSSLLAWAKTHPGQFTYPALPDFTGSMAVRTILYDTIGGPAALAGPFDPAKYSAAATRLWQRLNAIAPTLWRGGATYPQTEDAVEKLYSDGEISAFFTYGPGAIGARVNRGLFPTGTREAVPSIGNIANDSFLAIPANAAHQAAALVLANLLQDPYTQLALYRAEGIHPGIDLSKTGPALQAMFTAVPVSPSVLSLSALTAHVQPELAAGYITRVEADWKTHVLRK